MFFIEDSENYRENKISKKNCSFMQYCMLHNADFDRKYYLERETL